MPEPVLSNEGDEQKESQQEETVDGDSTSVQVPEETVVIQEVKPKTVDIMRSEPILTNLIVESYIGDKNEQGFFHGIGTAYFQGGHVYSGEFVHGFMHGNGKYGWSNGVLYDGEFDRNSVTGNGIYTWSDGSTYEGAVLNGLRHGVGTYKCGTIPSVYTGEWYYGKRTGKGVIYYDDEGRSYYEGSWFNNMRHGYGVRRYKNGNIFEGDWVNNIRHGKGKMNWFDRNEMYEGDWVDAIQHGMGQHSWFFKRNPGSQYPVRNFYNGQWVEGKRHGNGTFYYANGAQYSGEWCMNKKHGRGKYTFKNGMVYEGEFEEDHMLEYPELMPSGMTTPDITAAGIPVRPQTPAQRVQTPVIFKEIADGSGSGSSLPIDININNLLEERDLELDEREEEIQQVSHIILRYISKLKFVYNFYSRMGVADSFDNTYVMTRFQFWRMLKDCQVHCHGITLTEFDRVISTDKKATDVHDPQHQVLMKDYLNALISVSYCLFKNDHYGKEPLIPWCVSKLISENIIPHSCQVISSFLHDPQKAIESFSYIDQCLEIFNFWCKQSKNHHLNHRLR